MVQTQGSGMSIYNDIRAALETELNSTAGLPEIHWDNTHNDPTTGTAFIRPEFLPLSRKPAVRGTSPQMRYSGFFICNIHVPERAGQGAANDYVDILVAAFDATTDISYTNPSAETIIVSVDYAERRAASFDSPWYVVPVDVAWFIYAD